VILLLSASKQLIMIQLLYPTPQYYHRVGHAIGSKYDLNYIYNLETWAMINLQLIFSQMSLAISFVKKR